MAAHAAAQGLGPKIDEYLAANLKLDRFTGSVLVARSGEVLYARGLGLANVEHDVPNTPETKFRIGSITKQFTAMLALQLHEEGKLSLDDLICKHVPECPDHWKKITIHHLLTHTSGISANSASTESRRPNSLSEIVTRFKTAALDFEPGEKFHYSTPGYVVLTAIIEHVSGARYEQLLHRAILEPLGMGDTGYHRASPILKHRAAGYSGSGESLVNARHVEGSIPTGGGGLYSTAEDLKIWSQALLDGKLVSGQLLARMFTAHQGDYGYGWLITNEFGRRAFTHSGASAGFRAHIGIYPDDKLTVIVLGNRDTTASKAIAQDLAAIAFGQPYEIPRERSVIELDAGVIETYIGRYQLFPNVVLLFSRDGDRLLVQAPGEGHHACLPDSQTTCFVKEIGATFRFVKDSEGKVTHVILKTRDREMEAQKLPD